MSWCRFGNVVLSLWPPLFNHWHSTTTLKFRVLTAIIISASQVCRSSNSCFSSSNCSTAFFSRRCTSHSNFLSLLSFSCQWSLGASGCSCRATFPHRVSRYCCLYCISGFDIAISSLNRLVVFDVLLLLFFAFIWWCYTLNNDRRSFAIRHIEWSLLRLNLIVLDFLYH